MRNTEKMKTISKKIKNGRQTIILKIEDDLKIKKIKINVRRPKKKLLKTTSGTIETNQPKLAVT
jgi:hypothetical protein